MVWKESFGWYGLEEETLLDSTTPFEGGNLRKTGVDLACQLDTKSTEG